MDAVKIPTERIKDFANGVVRNSLRTLHDCFQMLKQTPKASYKMFTSSIRVKWLDQRWRVNGGCKELVKVLKFSQFER